MKLKRVIFILIIIFIALTLFFIRYSGFAIQSTISRVNIDEGIIVIADTFDGSTTNFLYLNDTELEEIENMTLEKVGYGKIIFNEIINLTQNVKDNYIDLDSNANISFNRIEVNTTELTSLEKSAKLYLFGLIFSNPRILKDGEICSESVCKILNYSGGTLIFNVTNFSVVYSGEETPSAAVTPPSTGGGGGGIPLGFTLDKDYIKVSLNQGEGRREIINLTNIGENTLNFTIKPELIEKFVIVSEDSFSLKSGESKILNIDFFAKENEIPDAYLGRIIIKGNDFTKSINVIIEVKEKKPLFDVSAHVAPKEVVEGGEVKADIKIINVGDLKNIDVLLYYAVKDFGGHILSFREETVNIKDELSINRKLRIPRDVPFGTYVFYLKASYGNISASSTDTFMVIEKIKIFNFILLIIIALLSILIYLIKRGIKKR
jgi:hypothetical protein